MPLVFGSPEAEAQLRRDKTIAELEQMALENGEAGWWLADMMMDDAQQQIVGDLYRAGEWESMTEILDGEELLWWRPGDAVRARLSEGLDLPPTMPVVMLMSSE
mgnify:FL=1